MISPPPKGGGRPEEDMAKEDTGVFAYGHHTGHSLQVTSAAKDHAARTAGTMQSRKEWKLTEGSLLPGTQRQAQNEGRVLLVTALLVASHPAPLLLKEGDRRAFLPRRYS